MDRATLPFMIWLFSTLYLEPDEIHHENARYFDDVRFGKLLSRRTEKDPISRPLARGEQPRTFNFRRVGFTTTDLGQPVNRDRSWRHCILGGIMDWIQDNVAHMAEFKRMFYRHRIIDCSVFHTAGVDAVFSSHQEEFLEGRGELWQIDATTSAQSLEPDEAAPVESQMRLDCEGTEGDAEAVMSRVGRVDALARSFGPFCDPSYKVRLIGYMEMLENTVSSKVCVLLAIDLPLTPLHSNSN